VLFSQTSQVPDKNAVTDFTVPIIYDYFGMLMPAPIQCSKVYFETKIEYLKINKDISD